MSTIRINGATISSNGTSIVMTGNNLYINGKKVDMPDAKEINIQVEGNIQELKIDACNKITVAGSTGSIATQSGDVECGNVNGSVQTMSGDVICGKIAGNVSTMSGDIEHS